MANLSIKDVQSHLHSIILADHPLSQDQRKALKFAIEVCDLWNEWLPDIKKLIGVSENSELPNSDS